MTPERLAEIRKRDKWCSPAMFAGDRYWASADRRELLAEVDRLRAQVAAVEFDLHVAEATIETANVEAARLASRLEPCEHGLTTCPCYSDETTRD